MLSKEQLEIQYRFPFGDPAISVLQTAEKEAQRFQHDRIGTEHLLAAYVSVGNPKLAQSLRLELNKVRSAIEFIIGKGNHPMEEEINFTPRAINVLELSVDEARRFQDRLLEPNHFMLGIVREGQGIAAGVMETLGVPLEKVRTAVLHNRINAPKPETPTYLDTLAHYRAFFEDPKQDPEKKRYLELVLRCAINLVLPTPKKQGQ